MAVTKPKTTTGRYRTRSTTAAARMLAVTKATPHPPTSKPTRRKRSKRGNSTNNVRPKTVRVTPSKIHDAGLGLYIMEDVKAGTWIARYSK